ncbi:MAG TPA: DUF3293 domain-containing protein [Rhodanobacteraceae bacterium]|nr:DUF3293 domain-containing protein [Rhodanobacteraceae bacterium]
MPLPPDTLREFLDTEYRVRLARGGCAVIRIGEPLPRALHACMQDERTPWGFITAWNPWAKRLSRALNRVRQRELLIALRERGAVMRPGVGIGTGENLWREPSLFVVGPDFATLDALGQRFEQAAIVRGLGYGNAELRVLV